MCLFPNQTTSLDLVAVCRLGRGRRTEGGEPGFCQVPLWEPNVWEVDLGAGVFLLLGRGVGLGALAQSRGYSHNRPA